MKVVTSALLPATLNNVAGSSAVGQGIAPAALGGPALVRLADDVLADASTSSSTGAALGNLLPATTEQATGAADNSNQATLMGQTVGASLAETGDAVNWREFSAQAKTNLQAAGYSSADIQVYLGAVKQTYQQFQALPPVCTDTVTAASTSTSDGVLGAGSFDGLDPDAGFDPDPDVGSATDGTPASGNTQALAIDPSQLPSTDLPSSSFAALAQQAYNNGWATQGSSVDIDGLVANTQAEMDNMGYSTDQVDNYMIGLFQAYNAINQPVASQDTPDTDPGSDGSTIPSTTPYDPNPPYNPLLDGDDGY